MPTFAHTPKVEPIEFFIDAEEFVEKSTSSELRELIRVLKRDATGIFEREIEDDIVRAVENAVEETRQLLADDYPRSDGERLFRYYLRTLKEEWYSISREDAEIIEILAKKYGAV